MRSLRTYLAVLLIAAVLPGTSLAAVLVWRTFDDTRRAAERRLLESARVDAAALSRHFAGIAATLSALATSPALDRGNLPSFHAEARRVQATQAGWYTVMLLSQDERQLVSTRLPWGTELASVPEPASLKRVLATGQPAVGLIRPAPRGGPEYLFPVRVPVMRGGQLRYVLSAIVNVAVLEHVVPNGPADVGEWTRTIVDADGTIAVRTGGGGTDVGTTLDPVLHGRLQRAPDAVTAASRQDVGAVYAASSHTAEGWMAVVTVPSAVLDGPPSASMVSLLAGGMLLMVSGFGAVLFVSRRLSSDLQAAMVAARALADGSRLRPAAGYVTEMVSLQRSLIGAAQLLEQRARDRDQQLQRAEEANRVKDQFLAVLGHELRNPLAPALTALELMRLKAPDVCRREREVLERQVGQMTRLVGDLLDVTRLTRGKAELVRAPFPIGRAVTRAVDMMQPAIAAKRQTLDVRLPSGPIVIDGDVDRIVQVLSNLLGNASKFTPAGGHIALTAEALGGMVRIECEDNGRGVAPELVPRLFEAFSQGPQASDRRDGGLGLGLSLVRSFVGLHGGSVAFEPVPSGGSRFVVLLPATVDPLGAPEAPRVPAPPANARSHRILVVDDNADAVDLLGDALQGAGHTVVRAASGAAALEVAVEALPDVAVLDIGLPDFDGYALARCLREICPTIRLLAVTGYGQPGDVEAAYRAGFDSHFTKPVPVASLLAAIAASAPARPGEV